MAKTEFHLYSGYRLVTKDPTKLNLLSDEMQKIFVKATANTFNILAFTTRKKAKENVKNRMEIRRPWVANQVKVDPIPKNVTRLEDCNASVGSLEVAHFLARQEQGGTRKYSDDTNLNIPTTFEKKEIGTKRPRPRKKDIKKNLYRLGSSERSRKSQFVAMLFALQKSNNEIKVFQQGQGDASKENWILYQSHQIIGGKLQLETRRLYTNTFEKTTTKPTHWLSDAFFDTIKIRERIFTSQIKKLENK